MGDGQGGKRWGVGVKCSVAKVIFGKQSEIVINDVIAMRTAMPCANSNRRSLIGSRRHRSGNWFGNKPEYEKRTIWFDLNSQFQGANETLAGLFEN